MLLENKTAILYGGGNIGGTVGWEGARVFLAGRTLDTLDAIASDIDSAGGQADTAQVDATDAKRVGADFAAVVDQTGGVDISLNMVEDRGQVLICAVARQLSTRTRGDDRESRRFWGLRGGYVLVAHGLWPPPWPRELLAFMRLRATRHDQRRHVINARNFGSPYFGLPFEGTQWTLSG